MVKGSSFMAEPPYSYKDVCEHDGLNNLPSRDKTDEYVIHS